MSRHSSYIGRPLRRVEDQRLITGRGNYVDDIARRGTLHAAFVRSPLAHATVGEIDVSLAADMPGVVAVWTAADLGVMAPMPNLFPTPFLEDSKQGSPLAHGAVHYVGEPVAMVVADSRRQAVDAAAAVFVDYDPLPVVVDHLTALDDTTPLVHLDSGSNLVTTLRAAYGNVDEAFAGAAHVIPVEVHQHRADVPRPDLARCGRNADVDALRGVLRHHRG